MVDRVAAPRWIGYLSCVTAVVICFGAVLVILPSVAEKLFGVMVYGGSGFPSTFSAESLSYFRLANAVMGALMVGWFSLVRWLVRTQLARGVPGTWRALTLSLALWYVLDSSFSLLTGCWQNAALNSAVMLAFAPGLVATRPRSIRDLVSSGTGRGG